jgi:hypothetical protein
MEVSTSPKIEIITENILWSRIQWILWFYVSVGSSMAPFNKTTVYFPWVWLSVVLTVLLFSSHIKTNINKARSGRQHFSLGASAFFL